MQVSAYRFRSSMFRIDPKEDEETNPFCYGRSLAEWLRDGLVSIGYVDAEVLPEDFGWVIMVSRGWGKLWVICGNDRGLLYSQVTPEDKASHVPDAEPVVWHVSIEVDNPMWSVHVGKRRARITELQQQSQKIASEVLTMLRSEIRIELLPID